MARATSKASVSETMSLAHILNEEQPEPSSPLSSAPSSPISELSWPSRSPSPPEGAMPPRPRPQWPTPPASQSSGCGTPRSYDDSTCSSSTERDDRPAKRRRTGETMGTDTAYLNLGRLPYDAHSEQQPQLDRLIRGLRKKRRIVVVAGAGISVSAGIPDFRSSTGIFKTIKEEYNLKGSGKDLFDASVYRDNETTSTFHHMVRQMAEMTKTAKPTPFHDLVARLAHEGRLLRLYTQNIDGLDTSLEPLKTQIPLPKKGPWPKCIQLHGGLEKMQCSKCGDLADFEPSKFDGPLPPACGACLAMDHARTEVAGKRSHGIGRMRPRMVLYSEYSPDEDAIGAVSIADIKARPDAIIVVGTSMKIPGVRRIVKEMCALVRDRKDSLAVWINNDPEPAGKDFSWDIVVKGTSDEVAELAGLGKWDDPVLEAQPATAEELEIKIPSCPTVVLSSPSGKLRPSTQLISLAPSKLKSGHLMEKKKTSKPAAGKASTAKAAKDGARPVTANSQQPGGHTSKRKAQAGSTKQASGLAQSKININFKVAKNLDPAPQVDVKSTSSTAKRHEPMSELQAGSPKTNTSPPHGLPSLSTLTGNKTSPSNSA